MSDTLPFFAPEVIQTSAMDCGPAALKCLLDGFGIPASYGRLREACQTDVDGTSIDALEDVAHRLGLVAEQMMVPADHLFVDSNAFLPALVVSTLPDGNTHFVIVWRTFGSFVQVMDPGNGRRWLSQQRFLSEIYCHAQPVAATDWRAWAGSEGFLSPLKQRLLRLDVTASQRDALLEQACADPGWWSLAALDATVRLVTILRQSQGVQRGDEAAQLLSLLFAQLLQDPSAAGQLIPTSFWSVQAVDEASSSVEDGHLLTFGAVLIHCTGKQVATSSNQPLAPELSATLAAPAERPLWEVWQALKSDGLVTPLLLSGALALAALGTITEVLLLRGLLDRITLFSTSVSASSEIASLMGLLVLLAVGLLLLEAGIAAVLLQSGRRLELRLRIALLSKIAQLSDRYFHSRLVSDTTLRAHELVGLRTIPALAATFLRTVFQLLFTVIGLALLAPYTLPLALFTLLMVLAITLLSQPYLSEQDMRVRTHGSALNRFYLDGLLGLLPLQTHGAERALRRQQEGLLAEWVKALSGFQQSAQMIQFATALLSLGAAIAIVFQHINHSSDSGSTLLLLYWALSLPALAQSLVDLAFQYPLQRNRILRLLEPLNAPEEEENEQEKAEAARFRDYSVSISAVDMNNRGVERAQDETEVESAPAIHFEQVSVQAGGHTILHEIELQIQAGEHVAIVGASGAGKSSLLGLLLGWQRPASGKVRVAGEPLTGERLRRLRRQTAWVDPALQLWNRTLLENLQYGSAAPGNGVIQQAMADADLFRLLESLPNGLQTQLGEGGGLVAGGEGQRVRLGRALARPHVRLALLDEPFRGLDREKRRQLLLNARQHWQQTTLLCITHDISETLHFPRIVLMENGRIVEEGAPYLLAGDPTSHYRRMLEAEEQVRRRLWEGQHWRRLSMEQGQLSENKPNVRYAD